jgi:hypothetical protein
MGIFAVVGSYSFQNMLGKIRPKVIIPACIPGVNSPGRIIFTNLITGYF